MEVRVRRGPRRTQLGELARPAARRADLDLPGRAEVRLRVAVPAGTRPRESTHTRAGRSRWRSDRTHRDLTLARWGHYGTPVLVFPTAGGDAEEIERHHLLGHLAEAVDAGRVKVYSVRLRRGPLARHEGSPAYRMWLFNQYHDAIASEVVPAIQADTGGPRDRRGGLSIGAFNALAMVCRYPQLFRAAICMSGTYHMEKFIGGFNDDLYFSSPVHFLPGMEGPQLDLLRQRFVVLASGSGRWEDTGESWRAVANVLGEKGVPTASTTGARTTTTTGRRGGRCCRPTWGESDDGRALASAVDLLPRARADLERLVAIPSVADGAPGPGAGLPAAADLVADLYRELGVDDVRRVPRRRRQRRRRRLTPRVRPAHPGCCSTRTTTCSPPANGGLGLVDPWDAHRARGPLVRPRGGGLQGQPGHAADRAARPADGGWPVGVPLVCEGSEEMSTGGLERLVAADPDCSPRTSWSSPTPATSRPESRR